MMIMSALCVVGFIAMMFGISLLLVVTFRDSPKAAARASATMLDLAPPALTSSSAPWHELPSSLTHPLFPTLLPNTGWLGVMVATAPGPSAALPVVGLARVPNSQAPSMARLEVVFESRSTGERVVCKPTFVGLPPEVSVAARPVAFERATRIDREQATVIGFFVPKTSLRVPAAEYRVYAQVDMAHSNEQRVTV